MREQVTADSFGSARKVRVASPTRSFHYTAPLTRVFHTRTTLQVISSPTETRTLFLWRAASCSTLRASSHFAAALLLRGGGGLPGAERGGAEEEGSLSASAADAGVRWGGDERGATGALGRLLAFQLPPHYINTRWCLWLDAHAHTHMHRGRRLVGIFAPARSRIFLHRDLHFEFLCFSFSSSTKVPGLHSFFSSTRHLRISLSDFG